MTNGRKRARCRPWHSFSHGLKTLQRSGNRIGYWNYRISRTIGTRNSRRNCSTKCVGQRWRFRDLSYLQNRGGKAFSPLRQAGNDRNGGLCMRSGKDSGTTLSEADKAADRPKAEAVQNVMRSKLKAGANSFQGVK